MNTDALPQADPAGEMRGRRPTFSVCIPAFNRAALLAPLLDSIVSQHCDDFEIVIAEDDSPQRDAIRQVVETYQARSGLTIRLFMNPRNFRLQEAVLSVLAGDIFRATPLGPRLFAFKTIYYLKNLLVLSMIS